MLKAVIKFDDGFTMIEAIFSLVIVSIAAAAMYTLLVSIPATHAESSDVAQAQNDTRGIMKRITRDVCEANSSSIWIDSSSGQPDSIFFHSPRNDNNAFCIDQNLAADGKALEGYGKPILQSTIGYSLEPNMELYRYKAPGLISDMGILKSLSTETDKISGRVQSLVFSFVGEKLFVSVRTLEETKSEFANMADANTDFRTMVKFRN